MGVKTFYFKLQLFWEGHEYLRDLPYGFDTYLINVETIRKIAQMFVAFSEKLNFTISSYHLVESAKTY